MRIQISCDDTYEAQKLAGLIYSEQDKETRITQILNIVQNEVIIMIKDGSAHSIVLKSNSHVEKFADFIQSVLEQKHKIVQVTILEDAVELVKK